MSVAVQRTKRRQQREETRKQILAGAQEFLRERSYRELSVDALMTRTGHTRTVFYRHFADIPTLILTLIGDIGAEMVEFSEEWRRSDAVGPDEARRRLEDYVDFYVRNGPLVRAVVEASHHDEMVGDAYRGLVEGFIQLTADAMQRRVDRGEVEAIDAPEVARALVWMLNGYLLDKLGGSDRPDRDRILEAVWTVWTRTLFPEHA
jgi:TetR/AcrR family transcriptional regulator, ethionamide resistance regulator